MNPLLKNVYVINLERSKNRLKNIDTNLKKFGIKYIKFNAVDGKKLTTEEIDKVTTIPCRYLLCNRSIVGCAMSHIGVWKMISESNDKWHLILEDDAVFTDETIKFLNNLSKSPVIDNDNIIISLTCIGMFCDGEKTTIDLGNDYLQNMLVEPNYPLSFAAYLITKNTAKKLYDHFNLNKIQYHIDHQVVWNLSKLGIKYYTTNPEIIEMNSHYADTNIGSNYLYLLSNFLKILGLDNLAWHLSVPTFTINMTIMINGYILIFLSLLLLNFFVFNNIIIYIYLLLELVIAIILHLNGSL